MVLTVSFVLSPVIGLDCHRRFASIAKLDASVEASRPHDFAVRVQHHSSKAPPASIASRPASVTIAIRPSVGQDRGIRKVFRLRKTTKLFLRMGVDRIGKSHPSGMSL